MTLQGDRKRAYQLAWVTARRSQWIKENGPCGNCGTWNDLEIDHVVQRKTNGGVKSSNIWSRNKAVRERELSGCQVLCERCHSDKSSRERKPIEHGHRMYRQGCRCNICVSGARAYWRDLRMNRINSIARGVTGNIPDSESGDSRFDS